MEAEIFYGTPVSLDLGGAYVDLGAEVRDGQAVVAFSIDDGSGFATMALSQEQAALLGDVLIGLTRING